MWLVEGLPLLLLLGLVKLVLFKALAVVLLLPVLLLLVAMELLMMMLSSPQLIRSWLKFVVVHD